MRLKFCGGVLYHISSIYANFEVFVYIKIGLIKRQNGRGLKTVALESKNFDGVVLDSYCSNNSKIWRIAF